jgi:ketosteroid isomerase-like protein
MSAQEIQTLAQQFVEAFNKKDLKAALNMLSDDLEVFDHVPYRFDNKAQFATFLAGAVEGIASMNFGFRQPSCRVFNDTTGIVNAYDTFTGVTKDGKYRKGERGRATDFKASVLHDEPEKNAPLIDVLTAIADQIGANAGQVAIAWVKAKGVLPIMGQRTRAQLDENLVAATLKLSDDQIRRLDEVSAVPLGYPYELLAAAEQRAVMTGNRWDQIDFPERTVA